MPEESLSQNPNDLIDRKKVFFNQPQLYGILVDANESYHIMGRGTGKTSGILAKKFTRNALLMPQSCGFNVQRTYQAFLTRILPSLIGGLTRLGYVRDKDYAIGKRLKGAMEPFEPPGDFGHFIHFSNGSGIHLISQDRAGSSNGLNTDWGGGDEAKYLNYEQFAEETIPTMRSNRQLFGKIHAWQSLTFLTSMPTMVDQKWILDKEKLVQPERIEIIKKLVSRKLELQEELRMWSPNSSNAIRVIREINKVEEVANFYRRYGFKKDGSIDKDPTVYFSRASALDNIAVLGEDYIRKQMMSLTDFQFRTEILNEEILQVEGGFYPNLDTKRHTYEPIYDNDQLERYNYDLEKIQTQDCRVDLDCVRDRPIIVTIDWGADISCMWIAQDLPSECRCINNMYVKHPVLVKALAEQFITHYRTHKSKYVIYPYYGTETARLLNSEDTYPEEFAGYLRAAGFDVDMVYMGQQPTYQDRYLFFQNLLDEEWDGKPMTFNRYACAEGLGSMFQAKSKQTRKGIEKDKSSEGKKSIDQVNATHFSDAWDTLVDFVYMRDDFTSSAYIPHH